MPTMGANYMSSGPSGQMYRASGAGTGYGYSPVSSAVSPIYANPVYSAAPRPTAPSVPSGMPLPPSPASSAPAPSTATASTPTAPATPSVTPITAQNALNNFANSAGMKFAMQQMANGVNNLYAAHGELQSGAAAKAIQDRAGQIALQDYFMPYMNYLSGQQAMGAQAASAVAGVGSSYGNTVNGLGQNYSNAVTGINGSMANALGQGAINIGNANANQAIIGGLANAGLGSAIGSGLGQIASSFMPTGATSGAFDPSVVNYNSAAMGVQMPGGY